jgi:CheY-like chemotaxis protein
MDSSFNQESGIKIYHELMANKVGDILLVSSPYDAFIMEEEGRLSNRIIHEYKGLNLSRPPRLTWVSSADEAFERLAKKNFDLILAMPSLDGMDVQTFGEKVKQRYADLPFFMKKTWRLTRKTPMSGSSSWWKILPITILPFCR